MEVVQIIDADLPDEVLLVEQFFSGGLQPGASPIFRFLKIKGHIWSVVPFHFTLRFERWR